MRAAAEGAGRLICALDTAVRVHGDLFVTLKRVRSFCIKTLHFELELLASINSSRIDSYNFVMMNIVSLQTCRRNLLDHNLLQ